MTPRRIRANEQKLLVRLQHAASSSPEAMHAQLDLGLHYLARNQPFQALQPLWAAEALQPGDIWVLGALAAAMRKLGQFDVAAEYETTYRDLIGAIAIGVLPQAQQRAQERYDFGTAVWSEVVKDGA